MVRARPPVAKTVMRPLPANEFGGRDRGRTGDLIVANDALSQLSYSPTSSYEDFNMVFEVGDLRFEIGKHGYRSKFKEFELMLLTNTIYGWSMGAPVRWATILRAFW